MAQIEDTNKRYYFFKFAFDFFERPEVAIIAAKEHGDAIINLFFWMITKAANAGGYLRVSDRVTYSADTLAIAAHRPREICALALTSLQQYGFIDILDDGTIYIPDIDDFVGSESIHAAAKRNQRNAKKPENKPKPTKKRQSADNVGTMSGQCPQNVATKSTDIDIEREKEKETDSEIETKERDADRVPARPTLKEIEEYITTNNKHVDPRTFFSYYEAHGWKGTHGIDIGPRWRNFVDLWEARDQAESKRGNLSRVTDPDGFHRDVHGIAYMTKSDYDMQRDDAITLLTEDI